MSTTQFGAGLKRDIETENEGVWITLTDGTEIKSRSVYYQPFVKAVTQLMKSMGKTDLTKIREGNISDADLDKANQLSRNLNVLIAKHLWVGWKVVDAEGTPVDYTPENLREICLCDPEDEAWFPVFNEAYECAGEISRFRAEQIQADAKN